MYTPRRASENTRKVRDESDPPARALVYLRDPRVSLQPSVAGTGAKKGVGRGKDDSFSLAEPR